MKASEPSNQTLEETGPATVLVVDDSELSRAVIVRQLEKNGLRVLQAGDGAEGAVVALRELPDVVVTDLEMPVMDGYQLARLLKNDPSTCHIALVILTSHSEAASRFWGLETGADAYILKDHLDRDLITALDLLVARPRPPRFTTTDAPQSPLDVLARVSRHLDGRLLEAVLVNRILERGVEAETLQQAAQAILEVLTEIADSAVLGLVVGERNKARVRLQLSDGVDRQSGELLAEELAVEICEGSVGGHEKVVEGGGSTGRRIARRELRQLDLTLRDARARLVLVPRREAWERSREAVLLERVGRQLAMVLDNAHLAERLRELSMRDDLTRLFNRRAIRERLEEEVNRAQRYGHPLSVAICDLDHFKQINDNHGHAVGDRVLMAIAAVLGRQARAPDAAGRFGGEEFLVVLPETDLEAGCRAAQRLRHQIEGASITLADGTELRVTGSLGVASLRDVTGTGSPDALLAVADKRLYEAKAAGRNRVVPGPESSDRKTS